MQCTLVHVLKAIDNHWKVGDVPTFSQLFHKHLTPV